MTATSPSPKLALLKQSSVCTNCGHHHRSAATRPAAARRRPDPSGISDRQLEVVIQQLRAHSIDVDPGGRFAYRRRQDGAYEKIALRDAILIATGRRKVAS